MNSEYELFNEELIFLKREKSQIYKDFDDVSYIYQYGKNLIESILEEIKIKPNKILILSDRKNIIFNLLIKLFPNSNIEHSKRIEKTGYDLIISFFEINFINNIFKEICKIKSSLNIDGKFIGCFVGENSLSNLRKSMLDLEIKQKEKKYYPRTIPFIRIKDFTGLLQNAKFNEIIVEMDNLEVDYKNMYKLMKDLSNMGESLSLIKSNGYSISKPLYNDILRNNNSRFLEKFDIISFLAK